MIAKYEPCTYRQRTEAPKEPGDYYGRLKSVPGGDICSFQVRPDGHYDGASMVAFGYEGVWDLSDFDWFGPVLECREG